MSRPARARFDLGALRANYAHAKASHGGRAAATIKANAYGHGAVECARALVAQADAFAVAFAQEAMALREAGITQPILVLEGAFGTGDMKLACKHGLWLVVHQEEQLCMLEALRGGERVNAWLKIDSGMHRAGIKPGQAQLFWQRLKACEQVSGITLMTHLASADEPENPATETQLAVFEAATQGLPGPRSVANSAGVLGWPAAHRDWARPGIMLYGVDPRGTDAGELQPVMSLTSEVFAERWIAAGASLGYGGSFVAERPTRVGLVALGYADGYPRTVPTGTPVAVDGQLTRIIGRVAMDMLTVDLTDLPEAGAGAQVELWGRQVSVNTVAAAAGTIAYELLCNVKRVQRVYQ